MTKRKNGLEWQQCPLCSGKGGTYEPHATEGINVLRVALFFSGEEVKYSKGNNTFREQLAQDAYDTVLQQLDEIYPDLRHTN